MITAIRKTIPTIGTINTTLHQISMYHVRTSCSDTVLLSSAILDVDSSAAWAA